MTEQSWNRSRNLPRLLESRCRTQDLQRPERVCFPGIHHSLVVTWGSVAVTGKEMHHRWIWDFDVIRRTNFLASPPMVFGKLHLGLSETQGPFRDRKTQHFCRVFGCSRG